jgi:hypothetical protein
MERGRLQIHTALTPVAKKAPHIMCSSESDTFSPCAAAETGRIFSGLDCPELDEAASEHSVHRVHAIADSIHKSLVLVQEDLMASILGLEYSRAHKLATVIEGLIDVMNTLISN